MKKCTHLAHVFTAFVMYTVFQFNVSNAQQCYISYFLKTSCNNASNYILARPKYKLSPFEVPDTTGTPVPNTTSEVAHITMTVNLFHSLTLVL